MPYHFNAVDLGHEVSLQLKAARYLVIITGWRWVIDYLLGNCYIYVFIDVTLFPFGFAILRFWKFGVVLAINSMTFSTSLGGTIVPLGADPFSGLGQISIFRSFRNSRGFGFTPVLLFLWWLVTPSILVASILPFLELDWLELFYLCQNRL